MIVRQATLCEIEGEIAVTVSSFWSRLEMAN
uniref:Uncharacterized protein n=1 Tax=Anguilla anguilla TaxID=7936 RepID=A0A0E9UME7_ANGAN